MAFGSVSVTDASASLVVAPNTDRISILIANEGSSEVYIGPNDTVTDANGLPVLANGTLTEDSGGTKMYTGPIYARCSTGESATVKYWERERKA
jgi:hypothetical protein